jgi:hypothetical protein
MLIGLEIAFKVIKQFIGESSLKLSLDLLLEPLHQPLFCTVKIIAGRS